LGAEHVAAKLGAVATPGSVPVAAPRAAEAKPEEGTGLAGSPRATEEGVVTQRSALFAAEDFGPVCERELPRAEAEAALEKLDRDFVRGCTRCGLHETRTQTVFGVGLARPELVFVGEGPGADEDAQGVPFVGRAGQLLTRMIAAMTLTREQVYICNVVKCRPPGNRTPTEDEMETCRPYLFRQLAVLRPKVIVTLGRPATQTLLATKTAISRLRGRFHDFPPPALAGEGLPSCPLMPTFHPAYLLRNPPAKGDAWADLQQVMKLLGLEVPSK
jgi:uracil-DNA glycosylase family 4